MNKKRLLCILLSLTAVFSMFFIKDSAAWIDTETGAPLSQRVLAKKLNFEFNGRLGSYLYYTEDGEQYVVSDQNLIFDNEGKITGTNYSTVDTEVRFRVIYDTPAAEGVVYSATADEDLLVEYDPSWTYNDGYFYREFTSLLGSEEFAVINSICYNGENITKEEYLPEVDGRITPFGGKITVEFQAKQKDFVEWTDIFTITTP